MLKTTRARHNTLAMSIFDEIYGGGGIPFDRTGAVSHSGFYFVAENGRVVARYSPGTPVEYAHVGGNYTPSDIYGGVAGEVPDAALTLNNPANTQSEVITTGQQHLDLMPLLFVAGGVVGLLALASLGNKRRY